MTKKIAMAVIAMFLCASVVGFAQNSITFEKSVTEIPDGRIVEDNPVRKPDGSKKRIVSSAELNAPGSPKYVWKKGESYYKLSENDEWTLDVTHYRELNDQGLPTKIWSENDYSTKENNCQMYFYDEQNRTIRVEYYSGGDNGLEMTAYSTYEYLTDFPKEIGDGRYYIRDEVWNDKTNDYKYEWKLRYGERNDYTISKKAPRHYEKKVNYRYDYEADKWTVSGYKYDYVINENGLPVELLAYQATEEEEDKWPLIIHTKNQIDASGTVTQSERTFYNAETPYVELVADIQWDKHDGNMSYLTGFPYSGTNRMKYAKISYHSVSNPDTELMPGRTFSAEYANDDSYHYVITDNQGNKLEDWSYYKEKYMSLSELRIGEIYEMIDIKYDDYNETCYHYVSKNYSDESNPTTLNDYYTYYNNEYYQNSGTLASYETYTYDALSDTVPYGWSRAVYSDFVEYTTGVDSVQPETSNQPTIYYNLQGLKISEPQTGQLLIKKTGNHAEKVIFKQ